MVFDGFCCISRAVRVPDLEHARRKRLYILGVPASIGRRLASCWPPPPASCCRPAWPHGGPPLRCPLSPALRLHVGRPAWLHGGPPLRCGFMPAFPLVNPNEITTFIDAIKNEKKMQTAKTLHAFRVSEREGQVLLTAQEYPWSVLQVIPTTPADFARTVEICKRQGYVAHHETDRTFCIIHLASGDTDGQHPERRLTITQENYKEYLQELRDTMGQAAVWYKTNIIDVLNN